MKVLTTAVNPAYVHEIEVASVLRIEGDIIISVRDRRTPGQAQPSVVLSLDEARALRDRLNELVL